MRRPVPLRRRATVFGRDPEAYDRARLRYPARIYEILTRRCGLRPGAAVFEVGPGTGIATRELLRRGADPLTVVEPDRRLVRFLRGSLPPGPARIRVVAGRFERVALPAGAFDLGVAATSFHWVPGRLGLRRVARALRPGGWWAAWNNLHGDPYRSSPFQRALRPIYRELRGTRRPPRPWREREARDRLRRLADLAAVGAFERISREDVRWTVTLSAARLTALWATFSDIATLPAAKRRDFLDRLRRLVDQEFGGHARLAMLTPVYTARRR